MMSIFCGFQSPCRLPGTDQFSMSDSAIQQQSTNPVREIDVGFVKHVMQFKLLELRPAGAFEF
jgi:hypothetical protein